MITFRFFFFKQKTAYELRISDWSSDVCSSDLGRPAAPRSSDRSRASRRSRGRIHQVRRSSAEQAVMDTTIDAARTGWRAWLPDGSSMPPSVWTARHRLITAIMWLHVPVLAVIGLVNGYDSRSEEHTSELQSLMRISYAVFCLKKKKI